MTLSSVARAKKLTYTKDSKKYEPCGILALRGDKARIRHLVSMSMWAGHIGIIGNSGFAVEYFKQDRTLPECHYRGPIILEELLELSIVTEPTRHEGRMSGSRVKTLDSSPN